MGQICGAGLEAFYKNNNILKGYKSQWVFKAIDN